MDPIERSMDWYKNGERVLKIPENSIPEGCYTLGVALCFEKDIVRLEAAHVGPFDEKIDKKLEEEKN